MPSDVLESGIIVMAWSTKLLRHSIVIETRPGLQECLPEKLNCMSSECDVMSADSTEYSYCVPWQQVMDQLLPPLRQNLLAQLPHGFHNFPGLKSSKHPAHTSCIVSHQPHTRNMASFDYDIAPWLLLLAASGLFTVSQMCHCLTHALHACMGGVGWGGGSITFQ